MRHIFNVAVLDDWNKKALDFIHRTGLPPDVHVISFDKRFKDDKQLIHSLKEMRCVVLMRA